MPTCKCEGKEEVGKMRGFSGDGWGQTEKIAIQNAYRRSGLRDAYITLASLAFNWECEGDCDISTHFSIEPAPTVRQNPNTHLFEAMLHDVTLKVWVECRHPRRDK